MADAADSKSVGRKAVWVRLPPPALKFFLKNLFDQSFNHVNHMTISQIDMRRPRA
jgi:hypothetical protein